MNPRAYVTIHEHRRSLVTIARLRAEIVRLGGSVQPEPQGPETRRCGTCAAWDEGRLKCDEWDERRQAWDACECWRLP